MNRSVRNRESQLRQMQPLILLGMHRSGTSLIARLLTDVGVHMGSWLSRDAESVHFQKLNRRIYAQAGSRWGQVGTLIEAMHSESFVERRTEAMRRALFDDRCFLRRQAVIERFFGRDLWGRICRSESFAWGWKDPRTSLTFPIWLRLFPQARCVHVLRNGIDVAISVHRRSRKQRRRLRNHVLPLDYSSATLDFAYSFRLWELYVSFILDHAHLVPSARYLEIRYEDLLREPLHQMRRLVDFAGHPVEDDLLLAACGRIDRSRLDNAAYAASYREEIPALTSGPLMRQLNYGYSIAGQ